MIYLLKLNLKCKLFADDTKLYKEISGLQGHEILQNDMFELCNWTMKWLLFFNSDKCKIMHIGNNYPKFSYKMLDKNNNIADIKTVDHEKDLGVIFQEDLKSEHHISYTVNKANKILGLVKRSFTYLNKR